MAPDEGECRGLGYAPVRDLLRCGEQLSQFCRRVVGGDIAVRVTHEQLARLDWNAGRTLASILIGMRNSIKVLRAERGCGQAALANRVGVPRNSIISIDNGRFDPSLPLAFTIADAFGLMIEEIFLYDAS